MFGFTNKLVYMNNKSKEALKRVVFDGFELFVKHRFLIIVFMV